MNDERRRLDVIEAVESRDGDGVRIRRIAGRRWNALLDPYLLIDEIRSADGADYVGGFPPHPHRGFETITYMLDGAMRHRDHLGNEGVIGAGDIQWMTAGRGVIHSEMPQQTDGLLHGFQIWLNLPAVQKMQTPDWRNVRAGELPTGKLDAGGRVTVIAGRVTIGARTVGNALTAALAERATRPLIADLALAPGAHCALRFAPELTALLRVYDGATSEVDTHRLGVYGPGERLTLTAGPTGMRALLLAGAPLHEPVWQSGPFVMNTREEIVAAIEDYEAGRLVA